MTANGDPAPNDVFTPIWQRVRETLKIKLGARTFSFWVEQVRVVSAGPERVVLGTSSRFECTQLSQLYGELINNLIAAESADFGPVTFVVVSRPRAVSLDSMSPEAAIVARPQVLPGSIPLNGANTFDNFVVGKPNAVAAAQARQTAEIEVPRANPLFLFGNTGLGKSHLMHAIALRQLERDPRKRVLYVTAEWFLGRYVAAVRGGDSTEFKALVRDVDILFVDDLHIIVGKDKTAEEFLHTFDALVDANKQVVLSADRSPALLENISDRLRSRLLKGTSVEVGASDFDLRLAILQSKVQRLTREHPKLTVGEEALRFMAQRINANTRELEGALNRVVSHSAGGTHPVTLASLQVWLSDFLRVHDRRVTVEEVKAKTAQYFGRKVTDLESESRVREVVRPRQVAMFMARHMTGRSLPDIARRFKKKDHTTVIHAIKAVDEQRRRDPDFARMLEELRLSIRDWPDDPPLN